MRFKRGKDRAQVTFQSMEDQIGSQNFVRVVDDFCEEYCQGYESEKGQLETGRKAYHPADLLKILVYGYFHGVSSSRKLERETKLNIEMKWLVNDVQPDHKTISDFRKDNPRLIGGLFDSFLKRFQKEVGMVGKRISIDGTKIKAYANREISVEEVKEKLKNIEAQSREFFDKMHRIDQLEDDVAELERQRSVVEEQLEELDNKKKDYEQYLEFLIGSGQKKMCVTDSESRMMHGAHGKYWGYNVQAAIDNDHHFITDITVTTQQNDKGQLAKMAERSAEATNEIPEEVLADAGYYKILEVEALENTDINCYVAINRNPSQTRDEKEGISFSYDEKSDRYTCQKKRPLKYKRIKTLEDGRVVRIYQGTQCHLCAIRNRCTQSEQRTLQRSENQPWIDAFHQKMKSDEGKQKLIKRRSVVEHPFGTIKYYMGQIPLLLRGKEKVQTEMSLYALGYNLRRYMKLTTKKNNGPHPDLIKVAA